jgi:hypothetical protein
MKKYKFCAVVLITLMSFVAIWFIGEPVNSQTSVGPEGEGFPLIHFNENQNSADFLPEGSKRSKRNSKFNGWGWVKNTPSSETQNVFLNTHWQTELTPIPTAKSDTIVSAEVRSSAAFFSTDRKGIYSEFSLVVDEIFKNNRLNNVFVGATLEASRAGGRVKYADGNIVKYSIRGQDMPRVGDKYVFFLSYDSEVEFYSILTAYKLLGNTGIEAIDGRNGDEKAGWLFSKNNSFSQQQFFEKIRISVKNDRQSAPGKKL